MNVEEFLEEVTGDKGKVKEALDVIDEVVVGAKSGRDVSPLDLCYIASLLLPSSEEVECEFVGKLMIGGPEDSNVDGEVSSEYEKRTTSHGSWVSDSSRSAVWVEGSVSEESSLIRMKCIPWSPACRGGAVPAGVDCKVTSGYEAEVDAKDFAVKFSEHPLSTCFVDRVPHSDVKKYQEVNKIQSSELLATTSGTDGRKKIKYHRNVE